MEEDDIIAALSLAAAERVGDRGFKLLVDRFGGPTKALSAGAAEAAEVCGLKRAPKDFGSPENARRAREIFNNAIARGYKIARYGGEGYPERLLNIYDPPAVLFWEGELSLPPLAVAIVGSRRATPHGLSIARKMAAELAGAGVAVISGMAEGIDSAAHEGALSGGGKTLAILGCGLDVCYPRSNFDLSREIAGSGALVSEHPPGTEPLSRHFPKRNRVISGLADGVVVVEAALKSGSLITARMALEQGREVFATPGLAGSHHARGVNGLLRSGARLAECAGDIFDEFGVKFEKQRGEKAQRPKISLDAQSVLKVLFDAPADCDSISDLSGLDAARVSAALMELTLSGLADQWPGMRFSKRQI